MCTSAHSIIFMLVVSIISSNQSVGNRFDFDVIDQFLLDEIIESVFAKPNVNLGKVPSPSDVSFLLYQSKGKWKKLDATKPNTFKTMGLKSKKPFKMAIHGFLAGCNSSDYPQDIFDAYLSTDSDNNLICVDWSPLSNPVLQTTGLLHYPKAVNYTLFVGEELEKFIQVLSTNSYLKNAADVHLIGHSLGGHIAGVCGHEFFNNKKRKIGRITGLDPAGPFFFLKDEASKCKLGKSDAIFVDVIHSNMGQLGVNERLGHVSFLPNGGGKTQPTCLTTNVFQNLAEAITGLCSHVAATKFFVKSIRQELKACSCKTWNQFKNMKKSSKTCKPAQTVQFGDKVSTKTRGTYCLEIKTL